MRKLKIYVCENFAPDYRGAVESGKFPDVTVVSFPCWCSRRGDSDQFFNCEAARCNPVTEDCLLMCGRQCPILNSSQLPKGMETRTFNYCQEYMLSESMINYIISKGGYLVSSGWLDNWAERIRDAGFDQELARQFYRTCSQELILIDSGYDPEVEEKMAALSAFLDMPYQILSTGSESPIVMLRSIVNLWRLQKQSADYEATINELRQESAEYSTVLSIIERITISTGKRTIIGKLMDVCTVLFGAKSLRFYDRTDEAADTNAEIARLIDAANLNFIVSPDRQKMYIKIHYEAELFGVLAIDDLVFPQYVDRYLSLAVSVSRIGALALSNAAKIEALEISRDTMAYISYHDTLTGLYNRTYFNDALQAHTDHPSPAIFVFDIDGLKEVNDRFGHAEGDRLIKMAAEALRQCFRETDMLARIGGDEFAAIVPECSPKIAQSISARVEEAVDCFNSSSQDLNYVLAISAGYALKDRPDTELEALVKKADFRMYENKLKRKKSQGRFH